MIRNCCKRAVSLGFAGLIEPVQSSTNFSQNNNLCRSLLDDLSNHMKSRSLFMSTGTISSVRMPVNLYDPNHQAISNSNISRIKIQDHVLPVQYACAFSTSSIDYASEKDEVNSWKNTNQNEKSLKDSTDQDEKAGDSEAQMTIFQRFKSTYKRHGKILLAVHVATSAVWFGGFYYVASSGIDIVSWMEYYNFSPKVISPFRHAALGDLAVMYLLYKLATPVRYTVTLGGTNLAIRYLKSTGYIQPIASEDSIRGLMKDSSSKLKEKRSELIEQSKTAKTKLKEKRSDLIDKGKTAIKTYKDKNKDEKNIDK